MKTTLVCAVIALFAVPAVAGEMLQSTPAPADNSAGVATATAAADAAATVAAGDAGSTGGTSVQQSVPSYSGYDGGCGRSESSTQALLIN